MTLTCGSAAKLSRLPPEDATLPVAVVSNSKDLHRRESMSTSIKELLDGDHRRLDALLASSLAEADIDVGAYEQFRSRAATPHRDGGEDPLARGQAFARRGAAAGCASLTRRSFRAGGDAGADTDARTARANSGGTGRPQSDRGGPDGVYATCEQLVAAEAPALLQQLREAPMVPLARHFDGPRAFEGINRLLRAAGEARGDAELFTHSGR
jgi:hypothetical protein